MTVNNDTRNLSARQPTSEEERVAKAIARAEAKIYSHRWRTNRSKREPWEDCKRRIHLACARAAIAVLTKAEPQP